MTTQLSTELITHKLKIKWEGTKYISKKLAESIFSQLADVNTKSVNISNPATLTYFSKYKSEIELYPLWDDEKTLEDTLYLNWFSEAQRAYFRGIWEQRIKDNKSTSKIVLDEMIKVYKETGNI
jgi:hypothetical protein